MISRRCLLFLVLALVGPARAGEILTNNIHMDSAPPWMDERRVDRVVDKIQETLEWDIRRISVYWYSDKEAFKKVHGSGDWIEAFFRREDSTIHLGPLVTTNDFDSVFGHELVHVILYQKYKRAIPDWLEEGLANYIAQRGTVDYAWLAKQPFRDVTTLGHPFKSLTDPHYHYQASQALAEMVAAKCDLHDMLQMAVGSSFEKYLGTLCDVSDVNAAFRGWVTKKSAAPPRMMAKTATQPVKHPPPAKKYKLPPPPADDDR